jgi:BASS family bile acid:Na+ symporter
MKVYWAVTLFLMMAAVGMSLDRRAVVARWTHLSRRYWLGVIAATFVLPPILALTVVQALPLSPGIPAGLLLMSIAPGAPMLTKMVSRKGTFFDVELAASYQILVGLLVPVLTPLLLHVLGVLFHRDVWVNPLTLAWQVASMQFLPLIAGMLVRLKFPRFATRAEPWLNRIGNFMVLAYLLVVLFSLRRVLLAVGPISAGCAALLALGCLGVGHFLAGPTIALSNTNRHLGMALLIAGMNFKERLNLVMPFFVAYAVLAPLVMTAYAIWMRKRMAPAEQAAR